MSNLIIDIGNTRTKAALFSEGQLLKKEYWEEPTVERLKQLAYNQSVKNAILSSTATVPTSFEGHLRQHFHYIRLDHHTPLPLSIHYQTPHTLGKDRIAAAAGALCLYPEEHVLVIDAGTCITMDVLTKERQYLGGNISPGIQMRLQAMHHFTANLPSLNRRPVEEKPETIEISGYQIPPFIGSSTELAMRNGAELGALLEVSAFMEKCRRRFNPIRVVFAGGDADFFVKNIKTKIFANSNLVLIGLNKILQHNVKDF